MKRGKERRFGCDDQIRVIVEIHSSKFAHAQVVCSARRLQQAAATIFVSVSGLVVAELLRLLWITQSVDALGQSAIIVEILIDLIGADGRAVIADAENLEETCRGLVFQAFEQDRTAARLVQGLGKEVRDPQGCIDLEAVEDVVAILKGLEIIGIAARGHFPNDRYDPHENTPEYSAKYHRMKRPEVTHGSLWLQEGIRRLSRPQHSSNPR